jgi:hypothetical protein
MLCSTVTLSSGQETQLPQIHRPVPLVSLSVGLYERHLNASAQGPIRGAAVNGHFEVVQLLLDSPRVDVSSCDFIYGRTPREWSPTIAGRPRNDR